MIRSSEHFVASTGDMISILQAAGVVIGEVAVGNLGDQLASCGRSASSQNTAGAPLSRERVTASLTQSWIGDVLDLAHPPHVAGLDLVAEQHRAHLSHDPHRASAGDLEGLVVRAVLLGLLGHQPTLGTDPIVDG